MIFLGFLILAIYVLMSSIKCNTPMIRVWCLMWGMSSIGGAIIEPDSRWELSLGLMFIFCLTLAVTAGVILARGDGGKTRPIKEKKLFWEKIFSEQIHRILLYSSLILAYASVAMLVNELKLGVNVISNIENLVIAMAEVSHLRYVDDYNPKALTRSLLVFVYLSGALVGWYSCRSNAKKLVFNIIVAAIPVLIWTILLTTKAALLYWLVFFFAARMAFGGKATSDKVGTSKYFITVSSFIIFLYWVQLSRYGGDFENEGIHTFNVLAVSATGHIIAFEKWFETYAVLSPTNFGHHTFAGVFEMIGIFNRGQGLGYEDVYVGGSSTNVYSALRNIIQDFGILVSILLLGSMGAVTTVLAKYTNLTSCAAHFVILAWVIFSPFTSIYNYNSILFASISLVTISMALDWMYKFRVRKLNNVDN